MHLTLAFNSAKKRSVPMETVHSRAGCGSRSAVIVAVLDKKRESRLIKGHQFKLSFIGSILFLLNDLCLVEITFFVVFAQILQRPLVEEHPVQQAQY